MSYHTHFDGEFALDRPLTVAEHRQLEMFAQDRHEGGDTPRGYYCYWTPNRVGTAINAVGAGDVSFYYYTEWLEYLIEHFLKPWGCVLNGRVTWSGEETGDLGVIVVRDNEVRSASAVITYPDPFAEVPT